MRSLAIACAAAAAITMVSAPAQSAVVLTGLSASDCPATGCFDSHGTLVQRVSAGQFSGPVNVNALLFNRGTLGSYGDATFRLTFWVNGGEVQVGNFGQFNIASLVGDEVKLQSFYDFLYDPSMGDLMIRIDVLDLQRGSGGPGGGGGGFFGGGFTAINDDGPTGGQQGGFNGVTPDGVDDRDIPVIQTTPSPTPEPASWALMIAGFGGVGSLIRRLRAAVA